MGARAQDLAMQVEHLAGELADAIEGTTDDQWRTLCSGEGWSAGVVAHHAAAGHLDAGTVGFIQAVANGSDLPPMTMEMVHQNNAAHARDHADCTKAETLDAVRKNGVEAATAIRAMSDDQLDRSASMLFAGGAQVSAEQLIQMVIINDVREHTKSVRAVV